MLDNIDGQSIMDEDLSFKAKISKVDFEKLLENLPDSKADSNSNNIDPNSKAKIPLDKLLDLETLDGLSKKLQKKIIENLLALFSISRELSRRLLHLSKKNRQTLILLLKICVLSALLYLTMMWVSQIFLPVLTILLSQLNERIARQRAKLKQRLNNGEQIEDSKGFWNKHLGSLSQVIKINRGGSFVPIREANLYEFSDLNRQQALLWSSSIPAYIKYERSHLELEKFIVELSITPIRRIPLSLKRLKEFPSKVRKFSSKFKRSSRLRNILVGTSILLMVDTAPRSLMWTPNVPNPEILGSRQIVVSSVRPVFESSMDQETLKAPQIIELSRVETKELVKTPSRLVSGNRTQKRAKLVKLSDLPPLSEQNFDREIESIPSGRPTAIRIRLN